MLNTLFSSVESNAADASRWALIISIISAVIVAISILANVYTWYQSGGNIKVRIRFIKHPRERLKDLVEVEAVGTGRQPAIIKQIEFGHKYDTGKVASNNQPIYALSWDIPLTPIGDRDLPLSLEPTGNINAQINMARITKKLGFNNTIHALARVTRGDGKIYTSKVITFRTPRQS